MSKIAKILSLVLVAVLAVAVFAGCGENEPIQGSSAVITESEVASNESKDETDESEVAESDATDNESEEASSEDGKSEVEGNNDSTSSKKDDKDKSSSKKEEDKSSSEKASSNKSSSSRPTGGKKPSTAVQVNKTGWPIVEEKLDIEIMGIEGSGYADPDDMTSFKYYEEQTNIHVNWVGVPENQIGTRKALVLQSKDWPDVFRFYHNSFTDYEIYKYGKEGAFVDVSEYVEEYAPNIAKFLEDPVTYAVNANSDGKIYTVPMAAATGKRSVNWHNTYNHWLNINKTWLDDLGLDIPKTTEEFVEVLRAFRDGKPLGRSDVMPYAEWNWAANWITSGWGVYGSTGGVGVDNSGKAYYQIATEEAHQATIFWHTIRNETGLMDNSIPGNQANNWAAFRNHIATGKIGCFRWSDISSASFPKELLKQYVAIPYPTANFNSSYDLPNAVQPLNAQPTRAAMIITKYCKNVPAVLRYYDYLTTDDGIMLMNWGTEKAGLYKKNSDGTYKLTTKNLADRYQQGLGWHLGVAEWPMAKLDRSSLGDEVAYYNYVDVSDATYYAAHKADPTTYLPPVVKTAEQITQLKKFEYFSEAGTGALSAYIVNYKDGGYDINNWSTKIQEYEKKGLANYVKLWQSIVDSNKKYLYKSSDIHK